MKKLLKFLLAITALLSLATFAQAQQGLSEEDIESINRIKESYRAAWLENDSKRILSLFTEDATIYPNGLPPRSGKKALSDFWFAPSDSKTVITAYKISLEEITGEENLAIATGSTEIRWITTDKKISVSKKYASKGNFLTVFSKSGKEWKIIKHIWNGKFEEVK